MKKIKVGILTFYDSINYGAALQAFALQQAIKLYGASPEFLSYKRTQSNITNTAPKSYISLCLKKILYYFDIVINLRRTIITKKHGKSLKNSFEKFRSDYMNSSREFYYDRDDFSSANSKYNGFITGSDMVWTPIKQDLYPYFLQFADREKRFSYAPSLTGCSSFSDEDVKTISNYLQGFDIISCREQEGIDFVKQHTGKDAVLTVDPTLLFNKEQWKELLEIKDTKTDKPYILCYTFGGLPKSIKKEVMRIAKKKQMYVRYVPMSPKELLNELSFGYSGDCGPKEFVELFINASFVVTNTFHGFLFSLISEKPFIVIRRENNNKWKANETRISNLLDIINETKRYIEPHSSIDDSFLCLDYKYINSIISSMRHKSLNYLENILTSISRNEINKNKTILNIKDLSIKLCTGCGLCSSICKFDAISMKENEEGFLVPYVDIKKCRGCGLCAKKCPSINTLEKKVPIDTKLCLSKDSLIDNSASGGLFITIARHYIEELKGVVYGVVMDKDFVCRHAEATTFDELISMQNSKYVQSVVGNCYVKAKQRLDEGREVLFTGTPCQIAALKSFLKKEYTNLLTMDIVCHGVPSPNYWKIYIDNYHKKGQIVSYKFRNRSNKNTWNPTFRAPRRSTQEATIVASWGIDHVPASLDPFYGPFVRCESYRFSCYYCQYACSHRISDITMGDCDSDEFYADFYPYESKSIALLNTCKAKQIWSTVQTKFEYTTLDYNLEIRANTCLNHPSQMPICRNSIYKDLKKMSWNDFSKKYTPNYSLIKSFLLLCYKTINRISCNRY